MTVAGAMLQRDAPLPTGGAGHRLGVGAQFGTRFARHRERGVAGKEAAPVDERHAERVPEQQAAETRAVDEERAGNLAVAVEPERADIAGFAVTLDLFDQPLDPTYAAFLGIIAQHRGEQRGVEMIGICKLGRLAVAPVGRGEPPQPRGGDIVAVIAIIAGDAEMAAAQPELAERNQPDAAPDLAEAVDVAMAGTQPVAELDSKLEGRVSAPQELGLVEAKADDQIVNLRDRRLADTNRADRVGFDQGDGRAIAEEASEDGRGRPSCRPAAGDDDVERRGFSHVRPSPSNEPRRPEPARLIVYQNFKVKPPTTRRP